jgi:hypothetical protein
MKRTILKLVLGLGLAVLGSRSAQAQVGQSFVDSCAADFGSYNAHYYVGGSLGFGYSNVHINRPGCPWLIIDVTNAQGYNMTWNGEWAYSAPSSAAECNGAKISYYVAKWEYGTLYTYVGFGNATGQWLNWFGSGICVWNQTSGTWSTTVNSSPSNNYRVLLRAWEANGTERIPAGRMAVN